MLGSKSGQKSGPASGPASGLKHGTPQEAEPGAGQGGFILALVVSVTTLVALALTLVWLNIERTKLAYRVRTLQKEVTQVTDLNAKLSIEREHLLSPHELGRKAERMGLGPAKPGQIRRLSESEADDDGFGAGAAAGGRHNGTESRTGQE